MSDARYLSRFHFENVFDHNKTKIKSSISFTFVESSNNFVCSAMNRTQKQLRCISGGHFECENAGLLIIGLLIPAESMSGIFDKSSDSDCGIGIEP